MKKKKIKVILKKILKLNNKSLDQIFNGKKDLNMSECPFWDSLTHVKLIMSIEKEFNIKITNKNFSKLNSIKKILSIISITIN
jgi:acyl carrier protein